MIATKIDALRFYKYNPKPHIYCLEPHLIEHRN
jgi:hypothetical protein